MRIATTSKLRYESPTAEIFRAVLPASLLSVRSVPVDEAWIEFESIVEGNEWEDEMP